MPQSPPTSCRTPGCSGHAVLRGFCKACVQPTSERAPAPAMRWPTQQLDAIDRQYKTKPWERFSKTHRTLNPVCQVISADGRRCMTPAKAVHHIISPHVDNTKFFSPANTVAICAEHHNPTEGEAQDSNRTFAPTKWLFNTSYEHKRPAPLESGDVRIQANGTAVIGK
jgi:hypothetical protein